MGDLPFVGQRLDLQFRIGFYDGIAKSLVELPGKSSVQDALCI